MTSRCRAILDGRETNPFHQSTRGRYRRADWRSCRGCWRVPALPGSWFCRPCRLRKDAEVPRTRASRKRVDAYFKRTGLLPREEALRIFRKLQAARARA